MKKICRNFIGPILVLGLFLILINSCKKDDSASAGLPAGIAVADVDGNYYHAVTIGSQVWLLENLRTTKYRDGTPIQEVKDNTAWTQLTSGAWCNYNNDPANASVYGRLYNFYAVDDSRSLAPEGWHVARDDEWRTLNNFLATNVGSKLKESGSAHWSSPNEGATNESGFTALPGGERLYFDGAFGCLRDLGFWWTSTDVGTTSAYYYTLYSEYTNLYGCTTHKPTGCSVRCVKDVPGN